MSDFWNAYKKEAEARARSEADRRAESAAKDRAERDGVHDLARALKQEENHLRALEVEVALGWCGTAEVWNDREYGSLEEKIDSVPINRWVCTIRTGDPDLPSWLNVTHDGTRFCKLGFSSTNQLSLTPIAETVNQTTTWIAEELARGLPHGNRCIRLGMTRPESVVSLGWWSPRFRIE